MNEQTDEQIIESLTTSFQEGKTNWKTPEELKLVLANINKQISDIMQDTELALKSKKD